MRRTLLALLLLPATVLATDRFFLIGGGPTPENSEAQIEFNVKWVVASLRALLPEAGVTVFFAGGKNPPPNTVVELLPRHDSVSLPYEALAAVYGLSHENRLRSRAHTVADVVGSTERDSLIPVLTNYLKSLVPGDQAMIIYNGHGSWERDRAENALRLWNSTFLSVREFERILAQVDPQVPVRFVMTQCYSGAFARAVHENAEQSLALARGTRCGFFAESSERESEGCSASIELGDYRDYTTYFVSGLTGRDRLGNAVAKASDRDADGRVTPFDSHLYTLIEGYNGDLPRSTSEDYLERAQPWFTRWVGTGRLPDNVYGRLAREMASRYGLPEDGRALGSAMRRRTDSLQAQIAQLSREAESLEALAAETRRALRERLRQAYPSLPADEPERLDELLALATAAVDSAIRQDPAYATIREQEAAAERLELRLVDLDRRLSQVERLRRARLMARALAQLQRHGADPVRRSYEQLLFCEALPLGPP